MNLTEWRTAVKEQAGRLRSRLSDLVRQTEQLAPGVVYGATAGLAVAPLVAAAQGGVVPYGELMALLGSAGVNLLTTELYDWRKRSEAEIAAELPTHLGQLAVKDADWRDLLDKLMQAAQTDAAVRLALGEAAAPYLAALQQDARRIIVANVSNAENVLIGDGNTMIVNKVVNHYGSADSLPFADVLRAYLVRERRLCDELPLAEPQPDVQRAPRMQRVFVDVRTMLPVDEATWFDRLGMAENQRTNVRQQLQRQTDAGTKAEQRMAGDALAAGEDRSWYAELHRLDDEKLAPVAKLLGVTPEQVRAARHPLTPLEHLRTVRRQGQPAHLVLLGDPGGGKSTWVRRLTSVLAWEQLTAGGNKLEPLADEESGWLQAARATFGQPAGGLTPIRIPMHRWASAVRRGELKLTGQARDLVDVCAHTLQEAHAAAARLPVAAHTTTLLEQGGAVILLDGLDEVAEDGQRRQMIAAVRSFAAETAYRNTPLLITCRSKPYARLKEQRQAVLPDTHVCTLEPLDDDAIRRFIARWYAEMTWAERGEPAKLATDARRLYDALPVRPDLRRMAGTPLLLTMMARTNQKSGLPDGRAELYENLVQELLWEWEVRRAYGEGGADSQPQPPESRSLLEILHAADPGLSQPDVEKTLNLLAYDVHAGAQGGEVEIDRGVLEGYFARLLPCALDDGKGKARAAELATNVVNFIGQRTGLLVDIEDGQRFRFTHYTFQEYLAARWIAAGDHKSRLQKMKARVDYVHWREAIFLALGCLVSEVNKAYDDAILLVESFLRHAPAGEQDRLRVLLLAEAFVRQCTPDKLRRAVDEERTVDVVRLVGERLQAAMQERTVPAADRLAAGLLLDDLRSQHGLAPEGLDAFIPMPGADFRIGKYPVTNAQFRRFVDAGGYGGEAGDRPAWWSEAGWKQRKQRDWTEPRYWDDRRFNRDTQPVVGVSWYEAEAYCTWLNLTAEGREHKPDGMKAQLPTQEQWMLAARNGRAAPAEEEDYPWRAPFDRSLANTKESNLGQTSPVDMYPAGAPFGVFDLAGNVWELTADLDKDGDPYLKGGSWWYDASWARASAAAFWNFAWYWYDGYGFRLVCVPISHG